jgi:hypothetical protein
MAKPVLQEMGWGSPSMAIRNPRWASETAGTQSTDIILGTVNAGQARWEGIATET